MKILGPIFLHFVGFLFPFVIRKSNFVGFSTHLVIPIHCLDELLDDALVCLNSLMGWGILLEGGEDAFSVAFFCIHLDFHAIRLD